MIEENLIPTCPTKEEFYDNEKCIRLAILNNVLKKIGERINRNIIINNELKTTSSFSSMEFRNPLESIIIQEVEKMGYKCSYEHFNAPSIPSIEHTFEISVPKEMSENFPTVDELVSALNEDQAFKEEVSPKEEVNELYIYCAMNCAGRKATGRIRSVSKEVATETLFSKGLYVTQINTEEELFHAREEESKKEDSKKSVIKNAKELFFRLWNKL